MLQERRINNPLASTAKIVLPEFVSMTHHNEFTYSENIDPNTVRGGSNIVNKPNHIPNHTTTSRDQRQQPPSRLLTKALTLSSTQRFPLSYL